MPRGASSLPERNVSFLPGRRGSQHDRLECWPCRSGFFKAEEGPDPCLPCPLGSFPVEFAATECIFCPEKQVPIMADGSCGECPPGSFFDESLVPLLDIVGFSTACSPCPAGSFTNLRNVMSECFSCGGNSFSTGGGTQCITCPIGQVYINSTQSCEPECGPGFFYDRLECEPCEVNKFSQGGATTCIPCSEGSFARIGSSTCFLCPPGQNYIPDIDGCGECPENLPYQFCSATCGFGF
ncbi:Tyrosine-protein kinase ephrin type A/B receptor-like protein [Gracilaria domingensis]|nr:Tyrosine-protein kinase ephrin type A/B receptor-like protein [Gracilaria domingensis]